MALGNNSLDCVDGDVQHYLVTRDWLQFG